MTDASGNPNSFAAMISWAFSFISTTPGSSLETLNGSANPSTGGIYTYTDASSLMLLPSTDYFIVLTAGTTVANGAYEWSVTGIGNNSSYNPSGGWSGGLAPVMHSSNNGASWSDSPGTFCSIRHKCHGCSRTFAVVTDFTWQRSIHLCSPRLQSLIPVKFRCRPLDNG